jgi:N-acetylmuramoyl-L-alanine amidase
MKKVTSLMLCLMMLFLCLPLQAQAAADPVIKLFYNGKQLKPTVDPTIITGTTLVPLRIIAEELGSVVTWEQAERKVIVEKDTTKLELYVDRTNAKINGNTQELSSPPIIMNGNTLLPLRFVSEQFGAKVLWDGLTKTVSIYKEEPKVAVKEEMPPILLASDTSGSGSSKSPLPPLGTALNQESPQDQDVKIDALQSETEAQYPVLGSVQTVGEQIILQFSGKVSPTSFYLDDPHRIVVDIPESSFGSLLNGQPPMQNGEIATQHPLISKMRYALFSDNPSTIRVVIDLNQPVQYHVVEKQEANEVVIILKEILFKVVLDAGHGGKDPGAPSHSGSYEKHFVLSLTQKVNALLEAEPYIKPYMTRSDDTFIPLSDRAKMANDLNADLFISIHGNTFERPISGTETYYSQKNSLQFANVIHRHVVQTAGLPDRNVRKVDFKVLRETVMPAALLEIGYLSSSSDEAKMLTNEFQDRVAAGIVAATKEYLGLN